MTSGRAIRREFSVADQVAISGAPPIRRDGSAARNAALGARSARTTRSTISSQKASGRAQTRRVGSEPADGQLLCVVVCHKAKTARDVGDISQAKRREARAAGIKRPGKVEVARPAKPEKKPLRVAPGPPAIFRRYRLNVARQGTAWRGAGMARRRSGVAGQGKARQVGRGLAWRGWMRRGEAGVEWQGLVCRGAARLGMAWRRLDPAGHNENRRGESHADSRAVSEIPALLPEGAQNGKDGEKVRKRKGDDRADPNENSYR